MRHPLKAGLRWGGTSLKLSVLAVVLGLASTGRSVPNGYTLFWSDEFNIGLGRRVDPAKWSYNLGATGWGNNELEDYTSSVANARIVADANATDGLALQIQAIQTSPGVYTSSRIVSQNKESFKYGYIEARLRMPYGQGIWPAFWMLGSNINGMGWPACGEADIMENIGSYPNTNWGSLHASGFDPSVTYSLSGSNVFHTDYHLFQASWTPGTFTFLVDDSPYHSQTVNSDASWPFNQSMFFIMNVAVGGNWPGNPNATTTFPQNLLMDYVRVYHLTGPTSNEVVSFFSSANSKFVSAENAGTSPLDCNRTTASTWEQFLVVDLGSNRIALQSQANGKFVTVPDSGTPNLIANGASVTSAATFDWIPNSDGTVYLRSLANRKYVVIDATQNPPKVVASSATSGIQAAFGVTCYGQQAAPNTPSTPTNLGVKPGPGFLNLTWNPVSAATSYVVYRSSLPGGGGMYPIATVTSTKYLDLHLNPVTTYSYSVTALNSQGLSLRSKPIARKPLAR
ncbi:MAG: family 16 glycosylhydrolase [Fimbriimonas sp.]|nr:family 16 glycosylhydrolase [Fimbriimonas sp.]